MHEKKKPAKWFITKVSRRWLYSHRVWWCYFSHQIKQSRAYQ